MLEKYLNMGSLMDKIKDNDVNSITVWKALCLDLWFESFLNEKKAVSIIAGQKYMRINLINTKQQILLSYLMAYFLLCYGYAEFIVPIYGYSGFEWMPNNVKIFESLVALVFFATILPSVVKRPSDFFIHVHFLLPVVPMLVLYSASDL